MPQLDEPIRLLPYDPAWPSRFAAEATALETAVGSYASGGIHHVGSTSVPGLDAKPIIDILVGVDDLEVSRACFDPLAGLGYLYAPYRTRRCTGSTSRTRAGGPITCISSRPVQTREVPARIYPSQ